MSNRPMPAHYKEIAVFPSTLAKGYAGAREFPGLGPGLWIIVAASPSNYVPGEGPPPAMVRVIVAPARVPT